MKAPSSSGFGFGFGFGFGIGIRIGACTCCKFSIEFVGGDVSISCISIT